MAFVFSELLVEVVGFFLLEEFLHCDSSDHIQQGESETDSDDLGEKGDGSWVREEVPEVWGHLRPRKVAILVSNPKLQPIQNESYM